MNPSL